VSEEVRPPILKREPFVRGEGVDCSKADLRCIERRGAYRAVEDILSFVLALTSFESETGLA
jgi:hypothetical protein